jgi:rhodanese-related sulfurtransferase
MIRKNLKRAAKRAAIKLLGMEFDAEARDPAGRTIGDPDNFDPSKIPQVVDGSGDTPGPNHKEDIGRTMIAAQVAGGVAPVFIDVRAPAELVGGVLPSALLMPLSRIKSHLDRLPPKDKVVTVYDQTGDQGAADIAKWLRDNGWSKARKLRGGFAEWIEFGEPVEPTQKHPSAGICIGDPLNSADGQPGWAIEFAADGQVWVWRIDESVVGPMKIGANDG